MGTLIDILIAGMFVIATLLFGVIAFGIWYCLSPRLREYMKSEDEF